MSKKHLFSTTTNESKPKFKAFIKQNVKEENGSAITIQQIKVNKQTTICECDVCKHFSLISNHLTFRVCFFYFSFNFLFTMSSSTRIIRSTKRLDLFIKWFINLFFFSLNGLFDCLRFYALKCNINFKLIFLRKRYLCSRLSYDFACKMCDYQNVLLKF